MDPKDKTSVLAATGNVETGFDPTYSLHNHSYESDAFYDPANEVRSWISKNNPNVKGDSLLHLAADEMENNPKYYINEGIRRYEKIKNPWIHAFNVYKSGKYNTGDKNHTKDVRNAGKLVMQDPAIKKWAQEKGIAFAEGTDGVLESYYNPTTVKGVLAKTALQLADPTEFSSYPDVWYSGKEFLKSPSWSKLGDVGLNTLSALPLIGKVTAPFKAAKMTKLLTRIEDANALVKGVEKANRLNRAIDTVPELLPVVRRGAEKVQDVTSSLITNPIFNYMSNQNKFDLVRNYRNINAAVDAVNIGNNTADLTQGIVTLLGYADGGEVDQRQLILNRANEVSTNYSDAKDFTLDPVNYTIRKLAKTLFGRGGISNCTLSATRWVDPNNQYMSAKNIFNNPNSGYTEISKDYVLPGDLLITKVPNKDSYHTMLVEGFNGDEPILRYSKGGHDTENNLVTGRTLSLYHELDKAQGGNHDEDHYFRYNLPNEYWLPEITVTPKK